jgi:PleD family two-component response regulator
MNRPRILILDDNALMREALREMLDAAGYETVEAEDGRFASQIHARTPVDLIITDLFMPETDGLEIIHQFRRQYPDVKIIAVSGGGSRGLVELLAVAQKMGAHRIFMKPFEWEEILAAVHELTQK